MKRPAVLVVTRRTTRKNRFIDYVGEAHLELLIAPAPPARDGARRGRHAGVPAAVCRTRCSGLLLVEGEDVEPSALQGHEGKFRIRGKDASAERRDRDSARAARSAARASRFWGFAAARNCSTWSAAARSIGDVQKEKKSPPETHGSRALRYVPPSASPSFPARRSRAGMDSKKLRVNSYHHQGVRRLAPRFQADGSCRRRADRSLLRS